MTVKELIEELQKHNPYAKVVTLTVKNSEWDYTDSPKVTSSINMFGETVWID